MSESQVMTSWKNWQPENLLEGMDEPVMAGSDQETFSEEKFQLELKRRCDQAEKKGFTQGQTQGLEQGKQQGYQDGLEQGRQEGAAQALAEARIQQKDLVDRLGKVIDGFEEALAQLDSVIPARLMQLALTAARSVVGKQIACDHAILLDKIQQLLKKEPLFSGPLQLWVSAGQLATVQTEFGTVLESRGWALHGDEDMLPGGCSIRAQDGELDATISTQWQAVCEFSREDCGV